jgi:hypothetical protein
MPMIDWIDEISKLWQFSYKGDTQAIRIYKFVSKEEWPAALEVPCVITYPEIDVGEYQSDEGAWSRINGASELHLVDGVDKSKYPFIISFWQQILDKAPQNIGLNDPDRLQFYLTNDEIGRILGPVAMEYGGVENLGLKIRWTCWEDLTGRVKVKMTE